MRSPDRLVVCGASLPHMTGVGYGVVDGLGGVDPFQCHISQVLRRLIQQYHAAPNHGTHRYFKILEKFSYSFVRDRTREKTHSQI